MVPEDEHENEDESIDRHETFKLCCIAHAEHHRRKNVQKDRSEDVERDEVRLKVKEIEHEEKAGGRERRKAERRVRVEQVRGTWTPPSSWEH